MAKEMRDWRGNVYGEETMTRQCETCNKKKAVRNCCEAEGDIDRTHWHGQVHIKNGGIKCLCRECANKENAKWKED